ncbi:MAG: cytochrome C [Marinilabiliales bacterium]|nr:MAG: cytochrome C [Marinilabiliales bacterium]
MKQRKKNIIALFIISVFTVSFLAMAPSVQKDPWNIPTKYKKMTNPTKPDKSSLNIGKSLYMKHCKSCHGKTGKGDGTKAKELKTEMWDLGSNEVKSFNDGELYYMTYVGRGEMDGYEKKITDEEDRWFVINYIKTFSSE